jgi:hypothetical protein
VPTLSDRGCRVVSATLIKLNKNIDDLISFILFPHSAAIYVGRMDYFIYLFIYKPSDDDPCYRNM